MPGGLWVREVSAPHASSGARGVGPNLGPSPIPKKGYNSASSGDRAMGSTLSSCQIRSSTIGPVI